MERPLNMLGVMSDESAIVDEDVKEGSADAGAAGADAAWRNLGPSPLTKNRSLSDGGGTPSKLSPSPHIVEASQWASKDDSNLRDLAAPVTPRRADLNRRGLSIRMPTRDFARDFTPSPGASGAYVKPAPLSPKLDQSQIYASPPNILPRRSRGLDFSRAATSLHHSTLAEQSSPDSSPTIGGGRAMNIPDRRSAYGGLEQTSTSLWSMMGTHEKMHVSGSLGSTHAMGSDPSSSSDDDEIMEDDMDEGFVTTPQISKASMLSGQPPAGAPFGSPAMSSLTSFQQRQRPRRHLRKKLRGPLGLGFNSASASITNSPSNSGTNTRRESISWQANQLHISSADPEEGPRATGETDGSSGDGQRNVVRRVVHRRANLLPKTKTFARIRAALAEETAPAETDLRREAEVVKQVRESDLVLETRAQPGGGETPGAGLTTFSSPNLPNQDTLDDFGEEDTMGDLATGLSSSFKQHAMRNSKGKTFWDTFSESSSIGGTRTTPPPPAFLPRGSSSGVSEDVSMDSPSLANPLGFPVWVPSHSRRDSFRSDAPQLSQNAGPPPPSVAEITRRINSKRRRDDDLDPVGIYKRRAVSPGVSAHNSPVLQSPMQRDSAPWGSRPGSNGAEKAGSSAPSDSGSMSGTTGNLSGGSGNRVNNKPRVGFQGMVDTNDGIMRMSIE